MKKSTLTRGRLEIFTVAMDDFNPHRLRTVRVWLPEEYQAKSDKKYPVLYMHDGQNLFDSVTSFAGEWKVDETIGKMMDEGYPGMIVVGIDNGEEERLNEYSPPWPLKKVANNPLAANIISAGDKYAAFIVETLKPYIDHKFNTLSDLSNTGIGGSSMGGIISFYSALSYQDIFGFALIFSSSLWLYEDNLVEDFINKTLKDSRKCPKMYLYHGTKEGSYTYLNEVAKLLEKRGVKPEQYQVAVGKNLKHNEAAWAKFFPLAIKWLVDFK